MPLSQIMYDSDHSDGSAGSSESSKPNTPKFFSTFQHQLQNIFTNPDLKLKTCLAESDKKRFDKMMAIQDWVDELVMQLKVTVDQAEFELHQMLEYCEENYHADAMESHKQQLEFLKFYYPYSDYCNEVIVQVNAPDESLIRRFEVLRGAMNRMSQEIDNLKFNWHEIIKGKIQQTIFEMDDVDNRTLLALFAVGHYMKMCHRNDVEGEYGEMQ